MPNGDRARGRPKHRNRNRSRARPCTPENLLENHLQKLLEEQDLLHNLLVSNRPGIKPQLEDLGGESNYEFDIQDEDGLDEQLPSFKLQQKSVQEEQAELNNQLHSVILAEDVEPSSPGHLEDLATIPLRTYPILAEDVEPSSPPNYEDLPTIPLRTYPILAENVDSSSPPNYEDLRTISARATPILAEDVDSSSPPKFEDLPTIPLRTYPYRSRNHSSIPLPITVGNCTPPKVIGQGFDAPFLYPEFVAKNERSRVKYIFSLVDSLALQMERSLKLNEHSMAEGAVEKAATGAVPKARRKQKLQIDRVGHAKYTITVNSRFKEPKPHNQSKNHRLARSKVHSHNKLPEILDVDCEFGMEFIEKFRANKVRDESRAEPVNVSVSESDQEKQVDSADAKEKEVPQIDEECKESATTITPNSDFSSELSLLEIAMAEAFKKQRKHKKKNYSFTSRPSTPITRPTTPINDDVPSTSAEARFYQQLRGQSEPEKSESNVLNTWQLLRARGPPPLQDWQWNIVMFMRNFNREKRRRERLANKDTTSNSEPVSKLSKLRKLKERELRRNELRRKYSYVPIERPKLRPRFYKAIKEQKEWLKAEQDFKQVQYLTFYRPQDLYEPEIKWSKKQLLAMRRRLFNVIPRRPIQPRPIPKTIEPELPVEEEEVAVEEPPEDQNPDPDPDSVPGLNVPVDRGQRLKNLLMDEERLNQHLKLKHLVLPEDPVKAIYLPLFHRHKTFRYFDKKQKPSHTNLKNAAAHWRSSTTSSTAWRQWSKTSWILPQTRSSASFSTVFYDAKHSISSLNDSHDDFLISNEGVLGLNELEDPFDKPIARDATEERVDFRRFIDIDFVSRHILQLMSNIKPKNNSNLIEIQPQMTNYMEHFYWTHLTHDGLYFHWFVSEGFFPAHYLTEVKTAKELEVIPHCQLDRDIMRYIDVVNDVNAKRIKLTRQMAHLMVTSYFRVLCHRAQLATCPIKDRCLLRCRFAISMVELYQQERGRHILRDRIDCWRLMKWALKHEGRVKQLYDEPLYYAEERASIHTCLVMRTPNLESFKEFYRRQVLPKPDALAINPVFNKIRRYPSNRKDPCATFVCPIPGCQTGLNSKILMAHFLSDHCRRLEELWLTDRMVLLFYPSSYPPNQVYCICVIALLTRMPSQKVPIPQNILNEELPSKYLYFVEHGACFLMFAPVSRFIVEGKTEPSTVAHEKCAKRHPDTVFIFWLAIADYELKDVGCRLLVYCQDRCVRGKSPLTFVKMSEFKGVTHLLATQPDCYLAIDYGTMATLTTDFKELLFIEVRYVNKLLEDANNSGDEFFYE
ncbi:uncharacterized protein LOC6525421 [Drosophila yakuba]|uniref:Uncharacterized protein, isoform B n=1 Tax=Drosophila yakuba TaxID=7245 RepID=A0A0R1EHN8_DROYA|nr:uncharacterized protein LOC6525421 [Drosophila yakuba]XP_015046285.1 uncharacterized protein LOC6525421 [Drosophila yakuba]KRK06724.1 uncharacterized protein Dyak_GE17520, isoform B [Drosophila yakuba]KRK06725.1 uncharacterized protein Dyak_GE17520, isoform C [Drosophila yakuba]